MAVFFSSLNNDLHELTLIEQKQPPLKYTEYLDSMIVSDSTSQKENYFFIGSYGGGLKANLWNLLILDKLENESQQRFYKKTLVMSGVSGGAVGIGNYSSLLFEQKDDSIEIEKRILQIGKSNVLSNELTYLLGWDWVREYFPFPKYKGRDRSYKSMKSHATFTGMDTSYNKIGYSDYWQKIYEQRDYKFPALIMNTTAVGGRQGVASTVKFPPDTFAGADSIASFNGENKYKTLTYFGAISTTNRFPFFSPTAKIPTKGSYLDGGYFENSGLLSAVQVYDAIAGDATKKYHNSFTPIFINIINSEDFYISQKINEWKIKVNNPNDEGEISSIIGTVVSIDKLPRYITEKIRARQFAVIPVMMPHKLSYQKVKDILKADVGEPIDLMQKIEAHNDSINTALKEFKYYKLDKWGVVQPPLARLLSTPAVYYQAAMINCHPSVIETLKRIKDSLQ